MTQTVWNRLWRYVGCQIVLFILTLYTLTSVCVFSILFSICFQSYCKGEFLSQSSWWSFPLLSRPSWSIQEWNWKEKLDAVSLRDQRVNLFQPFDRVLLCTTFLNLKVTLNTNVQAAPPFWPVNFCTIKMPWLSLTIVPLCLHKSFPFSYYGLILCFLSCAINLPQMLTTSEESTGITSPAVWITNMDNHNDTINNK